MQCSSEPLWGEACKMDLPPGAKTNKNNIPSGVYSHSREVPARLLPVQSGLRVTVARACTPWLQLGRAQI